MNTEKRILNCSGQYIELRVSYKVMLLAKKSQVSQF